MRIEQLKTMNIKSFFIALLLVCAGLQSKAQTEMVEVVYLKNGNAIKGTIIEQIPNVSLKIQTKDGSLFVFKFDEIEKITKEPKKEEPLPSYEIPTFTDNPQPSPYSYVRRKRFEYTRTGFYGNIKHGFMAFGGFHFGVLAGYQPTSHWAFGIGLSFDHYFDVNGGVTGDDNTGYYNRETERPIMMPLYLENRFYFTTTRTSPHLFLDFGYTTVLESNRARIDQSYSYSYYYNYNTNTTSKYSTISKGGTMINFGGGIRTAVSNRVAFLLDFGWLIQSYSAKIEDINTDANGFSNVDISYSSKTLLMPNLKLGFIF